MVNYGAMLLFGVVSLMIGSTTSVLTCPGHGGNQATATKELHHASALLRNEVNIRNIYLLRRGPQVLHHQVSRVTRQIMLPRVTTPKRLSTTPLSILSQPTTPESPSTTRLRMLPKPTTPRLQLISMPKWSRPHITQPRTLPQFTTLRNPSITLLQATTKLRLLFTTSSHRVLQPNVNYGVVLLLVVVSLVVGSTTSVPMSRGNGGYRTTTPPSYCTTNIRNNPMLHHQGPRVVHHNL
ncbi:uncharacterized protein LOC124341293 [Daphnia pulicaria]|uniref:uncharacterized protein LOC124341293 n=1 Tax=Daphnia pulicaria TaxID=35523 RepID=UPI001EECEF4B|nr:uncharacterized protein LOC124341293 [Daphnia pulicaria]